MSTRVVSGKEAREKILEGVNLSVETVGTTLGPMGNNVGIDKGYEALAMHDGVTVFRAIEEKDPAVNFAVRILRQSANKQVESVGDGTTVTTILAGAIYTEASELVAAGQNPMALRRGLEEGASALIERLKELAIPVKDLQTKIEIATISAEDSELGKMVGEELDKIGLDGILTVEESKSIETFIEHQDGMQFDKGWKHPGFINSETRPESTIENADILITDKTIINNVEIVPLFQKMVTSGKRNLVIIAPDITDSALAQSIFTKQSGEMNILCIQAPQINEIQKDVLADIALLVGGEVISGDAQMRLENVTLEQLGHARRVTSTKDATIIVGGQGDKKIVEDRIASIRAQHERAEGSEFQQEKLRERIAKLGNGVSIIKVGGQTEVEMKERRERVIDAVAATRAAISDGIVPGGEISYLIAREAIDKGILYNALAKPFNKLVENAGYDAGEIRADLRNNKLMLDEKPGIQNLGFDVTDGEFKNMISHGIIDPVLVPINAILNATSVAIQLLTTQKIIVPDQEEKKG